MKPEEIRSQVLRIVESMNKNHNMKALVAVAAPSFVMHGVEADMNLQQFVEAMDSGFKGFPDLKLEAYRTVAEQDSLAIWYTITGTHKGEWAGIPATGKKIKYSAAQFVRSMGDKLVESWLLQDNLGIMQQLGAIPAPKK